MRSFCIFLLALVVGGPALTTDAMAQTAGQFRVIGKVTAVDAQSITVDSVESGKATLALDDKTPVSTVIRKTLADVRPGDYVGTTTVVGKDGKHRAIEVHIFDRPPTNLAQFPLEWAPDNIMTNAAVAEVVKAAEGSVLKLKFSTGETDILVAPDTPILAGGPGSQELLKPGVAVTVIAVKAADGALTARRITVN